MRSNRALLHVIGRMLAFVGVALALTGCERPKPEPDPPVSFWANPKNGRDSDACVHATAQNILSSGLPYPHFTTSVETLPNGMQRQRIEMADVWVGATRYVFPTRYLRSDGFYGDNHPRRFWRLGGSLPNFYPPGEPGPVVDGMGSMVDITIMCSVDPAYLASWMTTGWRSNAEGIAAMKERYEQELIRHPKYPGTVTVSVREDLGMTEVLKDRTEKANGMRSWEASYWPLDRELRSPSGHVSSIGCAKRHDPQQKRYGKVGFRCRSDFSPAPETTVRIEIYVSQLQHMPAVFDQVVQLFTDSIRN